MVGSRGPVSFHRRDVDRDRGRGGEMMDIGILEVAGLMITVSSAVAVPIGIIRWCGNFVSGEVEESEKRLQATLDDHRHRIGNVTGRVDAIERLRVADVERLVKLETNYANLERGQARIEHQLEKMEADSAAGRAEIIESLRELRQVSPRT